MPAEERGVTTRETRSPQGGGAHACAVAAGADQPGAPPASLWDRFGAWPPAARLAVSVLLSLMLWVAIWFGVRAALRDFG